MTDNIKVTGEGYRRLVLSHLYIEARKARTTVGGLPQASLTEVGASLKRGDFNVVTVQVEIPPDLESERVRGIIDRFSAEIRANPQLFPKPSPQAKPKREWVDPVSARTRKTTVGVFPKERVSGRKAKKVGDEEVMEEEAVGDREELDF